MLSNLTFPVDPPQPGHGVEIAPGVTWLRMPLSSSLSSINVWALDEGAGWSVVDTGLYSGACTDAWENLRLSGRFAAPVRRVFVTHMHPDHVGMAGWFAQRDGASLWMTRLEYLTCRTLAAEMPEAPPESALKFCSEAGWGPDAIETYRRRFGGFRRHLYALPDSFTRLEDGQELRIGAFTWRVITGSGHSPEHACFYCPELKLFISGDQVLPRISSNVSVPAREPHSDPMGDWLATLDKLQAHVPDDVLVLPAHGDCFRGLHHRLQALRAGQQAALERLSSRLEKPCRVLDVMDVLFRRPVSEDDPAQLSLATGEAMANLNYLCLRGKVRRELRDGVAYYRRI